MKQWILRGLILSVAVVAIGAAAAGGYWYALEKGWILYNKYDIRSEGTLRVGDLAPDLVLERADGSGPQRISELCKDKPLVLVFGSYT